MIHSFLESWPLFRETYLAAWLVAMLLAVVGVFVVARDQIFVGAAVAQASMLGIALGTCLGSEWTAEGSFFRSPAFLSMVSVGFAIAAAIVTGRSGGTGGESHEAVTGFVYLAGASLAILVITHSPHGLDDIQKLASSSIIGATVGDVLTFAALLAVTAVFVFLRRRALLLFAMDPVFARAVGLSRLWDVAAAGWMGLVMGVSIRASGLLYAFGCLVLPALAAKNACPAMRPMLWVAPLIALATAAAGCVVGNHYDFPLAHLTVALQAGLLAAAWIVHSLRRG